ncbi:CRISPR-associated endoribonuclease Cas6 [Kroppenstedtia eburnea]|uniref:CRISPR-associated endoribonuclease Cas6 n=1 Tax=Kroppenstedtia eburnea TaxID=714067 RepID=A0A1N7Q4C2_9BACL|nr:CRISPR-associated endoribonuclease Cas6 [Kroppenstedtia eburnea]QKI82611.1 CRISPR-associated endoribonuclease Cas6 [Kroppenstedtia eburnea]SIT17708.1 CRISPR-associated endoribonuclease Cas6 [Kroppenstedtia eburnea]
MRLFCAFKTGKLPIDYRMGIVSIIKESLKRSDPAYYRFWYEGSPPKMKPFTFSPYLKNFNPLGEEIALEELHVTFSSPDHEFLLHLYNGLHDISDLDYRGYGLVKNRLRMLPEQTIQTPVVVFKTRSPILVEDATGRPLKPEDNDYERELAYMADLALSNYRGYGLQDEFHMQPLNMKKRVLKESNREFRDQKEGYLYFTTFQGTLALKGHPQDLQLLYQLGLGHRRGFGLGCVDVVQQIHEFPGNTLLG